MVEPPDLPQLALQLVSADSARRALLFAEYRGAPVVLAWALKDTCYAAWGSDPLVAAGAATALDELAERSGLAEVGALARWTGGIAALAAGQMEAALTQFDAAAASFYALGQPQIAAETQVPKLIALAMLGRYDQAEATGQATRDQFLVSGDLLAAGKIEQNLGNIAFRRDRYSAAEGWYRQAEARFAAVGDQRELARVYGNLADALAGQYQFREATRLYALALQIATAENLETDRASLESNLGNLALLQGQYDQALRLLEGARRHYSALGLEHEAATTNLELADAYLELNLIADAGQIYAQIIPIFAELGMRFEQASAMANYGRCCALLGNTQQARELLAAAKLLFDAEGNAVWAAMVGLAEAQLLARTGNHSAADRLVAAAEPALEAAQNLGQLALARWLRGDIARLRGDAAAASRLLQTALQAAEQWRLPQIAHRCQNSLGLLAVAQGDAARAEAAFLGAIGIIEQLRAPLPAEEFRTAFLADKLTPYTELARLALAAPTSDANANSLAYVELSRSRALLEMLGGTSETLPRPRDATEVALIEQLEQKRSELNWLYVQLNRLHESGSAHSGEQLDQLQAEVGERETTVVAIERQLRQRGHSAAHNRLQAITPFDLPTLQASLGPDSVLVEYFSIDNEILAYMVTTSGVRVVRHLANQAEVEHVVSQLRFQIESLRHGARRLRTHLAQLTQRAQYYLGWLYTALLEPLEDQVQQQRLVIVPHRILHYVPFHALYNGNQYVIEAREVSYAPSAAVLQYCLVQPRHHIQHALLLGTTDERMPRVREEIQALANLFPSAQLLLDAAAGVAPLRASAAQADLLHLACHGQFRPDNPLFSALHLADGNFTMRDAYSLNLERCGLVTLSACETGVNAIAPGDELIGLARGFFAAGAPSLLVSLWTVDDTTTADLMGQFYGRMLAGDTPAAALRAAQRALLAEYSHPYFWSPFVLLGRW